MPRRPMILFAPLLLAACGGGGGSSITTTVNLPLNAAGVVNGTIIGFELGSQQTGAGTFTTSPTEVQTSDRTNPSGLDLSFSADETATSVRQLSNDRNLIRVDAEADIAVTGTLNNGASFTDVAGVTGTATFQDGSFGDASADSDARTQISAISVFLPDTARQVTLSDLTLLRIASFNAGTNEAVYGVGHVGNETLLAEVPTAADPASTFRGSLAYGVAVYNSSGTAREMSIRERGTNLHPVFDIVADWAAGTVTADIQNIELVGDDATNPGTLIVLTPVVDSLFVQGTITGNDVEGTVMQFENVLGGIVGVQIAQQVNGGFFGTDAAEVGLVGILEGAMDIDDGTGFAPRDYTFSVVMGGAR